MNQFPSENQIREAFNLVKFVCRSFTGNADDHERIAVALGTLRSAADNYLKLDSLNEVTVPKVGQ